MSGEPTFRSTRVLMRTLFEYLEAGHSLERFLEGVPTVSRAAASQALEESKGIVARQPFDAGSPGRVHRRGAAPSFCPAPMPDLPPRRP